METEEKHICEITGTWREKVRKPDKTAEKAARARWDNIAKPIDGLGEFEKIIVRMAGIQGTEDVSVHPARLYIFCADNGIVSEGVTQTDQSVTAGVAESMAYGRSSVCLMARHAGVSVQPVDIGMSGEDYCEDMTGIISEAETGCPETSLAEEESKVSGTWQAEVKADGPGLLNRKVRRGTEDFLVCPAMTEEEALRAISTGIELASEAATQGVRLLLTGEMGIGNTTTSAAIIQALLSPGIDAVCSRGAGLSDEKLERKRRVIEEGVRKYGLMKDPSAGKIARHTETRSGSPEQNALYALRALSCVGGLDIAGMCGLFIGGAMYGIPVVIDGFISAAAALTAERMVPGTRSIMIASHAGRSEAGRADRGQAVRLVLNELGLKPVIDADMALGEGTGAVMLVPLLDMALEVYRSQTDFRQLDMEPYVRY